MKRLTKEEIEARMEAYEEAANHLEMDVTDTDEEKKQAAIVAAQIRKIAERFYKWNNP